MQNPPHRADIYAKIARMPDKRHKKEAGSK
jgi:hypothetical protein